MSKIKIAVDAGHGSDTAGKRTPGGYREHWIDVACAVEVEKLLIFNGFEVFRSGWDDENSKDDPDVALSKRQKLIKDEECDASVSIHANAYGNGSSYNSAQGVVTLIHNNDKYIVDSMKLAECIQNRLIEGTPQKNRGVARQALSMCNCPKLGVKAAVLVELAFMTNYNEAKLLQNKEFIKEQAAEIVHGICDYYGVPFKKEKETQAKPMTDIKPVSKFKSYKVKVTASTLNYRSGPGTKYIVKGAIKKGEAYTIVEEKNNWGKLKSGAGWINLKYTQKI